MRRWIAARLSCVCAIAGLAALVAATGAAPAHAIDIESMLMSPEEKLQRNVAAGRPYFIDFRAGLASVTGHSYVVFGRVNERGQLQFIRNAEIWPANGDAGLLVGIFVPVRARVRLVDGDSKQEAVINYRRYLTAVEYAAVMRAVESERRHDLYWSVLLFNCNNFTSNIAEALGLRTPSSLLLPNVYIAALRALNGRQD